MWSCTSSLTWSGQRWGKKSTMLAGHFAISFLNENVPVLRWKLGRSSTAIFCRQWMVDNHRGPRTLYEILFKNEIAQVSCRGVAPKNERTGEAGEEGVPNENEQNAHVTWQTCIRRMVFFRLSRVSRKVEHHWRGPTDRTTRVCTIGYRTLPTKPSGSRGSNVPLKSHWPLNVPLHRKQCRIIDTSAIGS